MLKRNITRRDFLDNTLLAAGGAFLASGAEANQASPPPQSGRAPDNYPPLLTGMRGNNDASYRHAHELALGGRRDFGEVDTVDREYDLVVVGGGISGLAAAHFYRKRAGSQKKVLILDNNDDFGGHARRNEFAVNGRTHLGYGGSQTLEEPGDYSRTARGLLKDLGVDLAAFETSFDKGFYSRHKLGSVTYFNKKEYGADKIVNYTLSDFGGFLEGIVRPSMGYEDAVNQMPLSATAREQLKKVVRGEPDAFPGRDAGTAARRLKETAYPRFLEEHLGVDDPQVLHLLRKLSADDWGMGTDALSAYEALYAGAPGLSRERLIAVFGEKAVRRNTEGEPYIHHFPDGNATLARLLVRSMIPRVAPGNSAEDVVMARFKYDELDAPGAPVRLRLNSTVIEARHDGDLKGAPTVSVTYVNKGRAFRVKAKHCVMACYNRMVPHLVPDLGQKQKDALRRQVKIPLVYTTVMLNNWKALKELGIAAAYCPGNMHHLVIADFPVSMGGRKFPGSAAEPMALTMICTPLSKKPGRPPKEQFKEGRHLLQGIPFPVIEDEIVEHLNGMLGPAGFDAERDIHAITVNRWSHGYTYGGTGLHDTDLWKHIKVGRRPHGRIAIANSDSGGDAYVDAAIDQAWRAVKELG